MSPSRVENPWDSVRAEWRLTEKVLTKTIEDWRSDNQRGHAQIIAAVTRSHQRLQRLAHALFASMLAALAVLFTLPI
jgi:hemolysin-activating ACP:hemolysin acyltransferase